MAEVILYNPGNHQCATLKKLLTDKGITFKEVDCAQASMNFVVAPVLEVDGEKMNFIRAKKWLEEEFNGRNCC